MECGMVILCGKTRRVGFFSPPVLLWRYSISAAPFVGGPPASYCRTRGSLYSGDFYELLSLSSVLRHAKIM